MSADPPYPKRRFGCLRTILWLFVLVAILAAAMPFAFKAGDEYGYVRGHTVGFREGFAENKDQRTLERRVGLNVALGTDVDLVLEGLASFEEPAVPVAFTTAIDALTQDLIAQTGRAYPFETGHERRALDAWAEVRARVVSGQYQQLRLWQRQRAPLPGMRLSLDHHAVATDLHTVMKDEACSLMRDLWTVSAGPEAGRPVLPGLCVLVDRDLLGPWMDQLQKAALDRDVVASVSQTETRNRRTIMELATAELRIDGIVRHDYESKVFEGWVFEQRDVATLEVRGTGIVKSGFRMHESYAVAVDPDAKVIHVTLPRAEILSNTLVPKFAQETEGWWTSLDTKQRNAAIEALQARVEEQALKDGILQEAESRAQTLVQDLYSPLTALPGSPYTVVVAFEGVSE